MFAIRSTGADTEEVLEQVNAIGIVLTGLLARTHRDLLLAPATSPAGWAHALVRAYAIATNSTTRARITGTVINIHFASGSSVALATHATERVVQIQTLFRSDWVARIAEAFVDLSFAL